MDPHAEAGQVPIPEDGILVADAESVDGALEILSSIRLGMATPGSAIPVPESAENPQSNRKHPASWGAWASASPPACVGEEGVSLTSER